MNLLENEVLEIKKLFVPLSSSNTQSSNRLESEGATEEGGAPKKDIGEVSDKREENSEEE